MDGWKGVYTQQGITLLAKLTSGGKLNITRAVVGANKVNSASLEQQTQISNIKQELKFQTPSYPETNVCKLPVFLSNQGLTTDYTAYQIGFYAYDPDKGEILYFIAQSDTGTPILAESKLKNYSAMWEFYFDYGQADSVNVTVDATNAVTFDMLEEVRVIAERGVSKSATGEVVIIDNTAEVPFLDFKLYGKSLQRGTPTTTSAVGIYAALLNGIGVMGKNLLSMGSVEVNNHTYFTLPMQLPTGQYTFSANITSNDTDSEHSTVVFMNSGNNVAYIPLKRGKATYTFNATKPITGVDFCAGYNYTQGEGDTATWSNIQLEYGAVATEYTPAETLQYAPISGISNIEGIAVSSGGNYIDSDGQAWIGDELDFVNETHTKNVNRIRITHTNAKTFLGTDGLVYYPLPQAGVYGTPALCTHFESSLLSFNSTGASLKFPFTSVDEFNTFMETNTVYAVYKLATPIVTKISQENMAAVNAMIANNPTTVIMTNVSSGTLYSGIKVECIRDVHEVAFKRVFEKIDKQAKKIVTISNSSDETYRQDDGWFVFTVKDKTEYYITSPVKLLEITYPTDEHFESYIKFKTHASEDMSVQLPANTFYTGTIPTLYANMTYELSIKDKVITINSISTMGSNVIEGEGGVT